MPRAGHGSTVAAPEVRLSLDDVFPNPSSPEAGEVEAKPSPTRQSRLRDDYAPPGTAQRRKPGRPPKVRHDSVVDGAIDGFGDPFHVELKPGFVAYWVSQRDIAVHQRRPWVQATWGDPRVVSYLGAAPGPKGTPIKHQTLTLYLMSAVDHRRIQAGDPSRQRHVQLRKHLFDIAKNSEAYGQKGRAEYIQQDVEV